MDAKDRVATIIGRLTIQLEEMREALRMSIDENAKLRANQKEPETAPPPNDESPTEERTLQ